MATVAASRRGSLLGKTVAALHARAAVRKGKPSRLGAFISDHTGTLAALGFADAAAWHTSTTYGLVATAACILIAEFKVRSK